MHIRIRTVAFLKVESKERVVVRGPRRWLERYGINAEGGEKKSEREREKEGKRESARERKRARARARTKERERANEFGCMRGERITVEQQRWNSGERKENDSHMSERTKEGEVEREGRQV